MAMVELARKLGLDLFFGDRGLEARKNGQIMSEGSPEDIQDYLDAEQEALEGIQDYLTRYDIRPGTGQWGSLVDQVVKILEIGEKGDTMYNQDLDAALDRGLKVEYGFRVLEAEAEVDSIREVATAIRDEYGRWPSHVALPKDNVNARVAVMIGGLPEMRGLVARPGTVWLGFREGDHPIRKVPSWIKDEPDLEGSTFFDDEYDEVLEMLEEVEMEVEAGLMEDEASQDEIVSFVDRLVKAGEIELDGSNIDALVAAIMED